MKKRYFVIFAGRERGVFDSFEACLAQVHRVKNCYRGYSKWEEVVDAVVMEMPDQGPFLFDVQGKRILFHTYERFRDFVMGVKYH